MSADKWCPTQSGRFSGYEPHYRETKEGEWNVVPVNDLYGAEAKYGIGAPLVCGGILRTIGLYGYAQAQA